MNDTSSGLPVWAVVVIALLSALGTALGGWVLSFYKQIKQDKRDDAEAKNKQRLAENEEGLAIYREIVTTLQKERQNLMEHITSMEKDHLECVSNHSKLTIRVEFLEKEITELKAEIEEYKRKGKIS